MATPEQVKKFIEKVAPFAQNEYKKGKMFYGCSNYPNCKFTTWDKPVNSFCPKCNSIMLEHVDRNGKKTLHCSNEKCELSSLKKKK